MEFEEQRRLRDSPGYALRLELDAPRREFTDSTDRALLGAVPMDRETARETPELRVGVARREAIVVLTSRQDSALLAAAAESQRSRVVGAVRIALTVVAAAVLIVPVSWVYAQFKRGCPPGCRLITLRSVRHVTGNADGRTRRVPCCVCAVPHPAEARNS